MADIELLKRLVSACDIERCADEEERDRNLNEFYSVLEPEDVAALIAENEEMAERLRMFELIHGGRAADLASEMHALRAEVRRLKILAGEDVPPLPEEFVGPMPENCNARLRRKLKEQAGPPVIPDNLNGLADAAFAMADRGEDPSDMLAMLQAGLKKAQPQWSEQKARTVNGMCMTWRHDFDLDRREHDFGSCGMTDAEREALRRQMGQLFEHHVAPVIAENEALKARQREQIAWEAAQGIGLCRYVTDARYQKFSPNIQRHYRPYTGAAAELDRLKAELERLERENAELKRREADRDDGAEIVCVVQAAELDQLKAELERVRADAERASYWKQRAKSAEGHLLAGDFDVAAKALHKRTAMASTPWEELADDKRLQIQQAAFEVIHAVNSQRDERMPADAEMGKGGRADA